MRRRRYGDVTLLIRHNEYLPIDDLTDSVWLACERDCTVGEIILSVADRHQLPLDEALAATVATLERLRALGFVTYEGGPEAPEEVERHE